MRMMMIVGHHPSFTTNNLSKQQHKWASKSVWIWWNLRFNEIVLCSIVSCAMIGIDCDENCEFSFMCWLMWSDVIQFQYKEFQFQCNSGREVEMKFSCELQFFLNGGNCWDLVRLVGEKLKKMQATFIEHSKSSHWSCVYIFFSIQQFAHYLWAMNELLFAFNLIFFSWV